LQAEGESKLHSCLVVGDLNAGPTISRGNYEMMLKAGFKDCVAACSQTAIVTWDPANRLNRNGVHGTCAPQQVDHVFQSSRAWGWHPEGIQRVLDEAFIPAGEGAVTLSDHYGVLVELRAANPMYMYAAEK
jgi:endonuclease/exonuclease/phosphatase family metal-dependent hydrolase